MARMHTACIDEATLVTPVLYSAKLKYIYLKLHTKMFELPWNASILDTLSF